MKKIHLLKFFIIGFLVVGFNQACTDLDEELFDTVTGDNFFKTDEELIAGLGSAYTQMYNIGSHNNFMSSNEVASDEIMIPQRGTDWFDGGVWLRQHRHEYNSEEGQLNNAWNVLFGGVSTCNRLIAQFEELGNPATDPFIAELKALRGYFYWQLLDMFGNVPIVTGFADAPEEPETRSREEVYNFLVNELETEVPKLSQSNDGSTYGRMNFWAGKMLLAKLYLNAEVYTGNAEWQKAADATEEIVNSGLYSLTANYFANFNRDNSGSSEFIFAVPYDQVFATGFNIAQMTLHYNSVPTWDLEAQPWNGYCSLQEFYNSYEDEDIRKGVPGNQQIRGNFHAGPQFAADGITPIIDGGADDPDGPELVFTPEVNEHFPNTYRQAGVRVGKFEYYNGARPDLDNDFPVFRYADVLMIHAEALWRLNNGDADALALVNQIRERANIEPFDELNAENLLAERGRELFYENHRRTDLIRFGAYNDEWEFKPVSDPTKNIYPIPQAQIDANKNLVQNPGY
jgi:hypothetical protein